MPDLSLPELQASLGQPQQPGPGSRPARRGPLPDAVAVRQVPVPDHAPPFDDQAVPHLGRAADRSSAVPAREAPAVDAAPGQDLCAEEAAAQRAAMPAGRLIPPAEPSRPPGGSRWPSQFAQVLTETLAGARPPGQLVPWTTEQTRRRISQLGPLLAAAHQPRVRRVIVTSPAPDVLEMVIIVGFGSRVRALAVRLERDGPTESQAPPPRACRPAGSGQGPPVAAANRLRAPRDGRWCCTALEAA